jgi:nodulation protein E
MAHQRVVVTGMGVVSALGQGLEATWAGLAEGRSGIGMIDRKVADNDKHPYQGPAAVVGPLDTTALEVHTGPRPLAHLDPLSAFAVVSGHEALEQAGLIGHPVLERRTALIWGAGSGGNGTIEESYARTFLKGGGNVHPLTIPKQMISAPASHLSMLFGVQGPAFTVASACASSGHAIGEGLWMIRSGRADVALVGGSEAALTYGSWLGWLALKAMADDTCRPFSLNRKGMVLGEGGAALVLESYEHATARGATILAELSGYGATSDAYHITMPHGRGAEAAIRAAHEDAGVPLDAPVLISSHGTGTPLNDKIESAAMRAVYGEHLGASRVIATKSSHGHLIGGAAAIELVTGIAALNHRVAPAVLNGLGADPECDAPVVWEAQEIKQDVLVSNSFAFGGLNAVLIAKRFQG